ncbi:MAG: hypothetical protein IPM45_16315 [Acidimicrobiales bacterium]|nr:hypothetical protein [Acidimicrobiales bacterium]
MSADPARAARTLGRRRRRPSGRAVLGGLLVAVSAVGIFLAAGGRGTPGQPYVVAARSLPPGTLLRASDLVTARLDLPRGFDGRVFADTAALEGAVTVAPLAAGDLVQASSVVAGAAPGSYELSLALDGDRAVDGRLAPGDRVAVVATYGTGDGAYSLTVVERALVVGVDSLDGSLGGAGSTVTLALPAAADGVAVAHAARAGEVTLLRATAAPAGDRATPSYRPDPNPAAGSAP